MLHAGWTLAFWIVGMLSLCGADDPCQSLIALDPPEVVGELGDNLLVNCTTPEESPEAVSWTYGGTESEKEDEKNFHTLVLPLSQWDMRARCTVKLNYTFECSKDLKITVYNLPDLKLTQPHSLYDGNDYELRCYIMNVAPVRNLRVTWDAGNQTLRTQTFHQSSLTPVNVSSALNITVHRNLTGVAFTCAAELDLGPLEPEFQPPPRSLTTTLDVAYPPVIQHCPGELSAVEHVHSLDMLPCYADGNPAVTAQWYFGRDLINGSEALTRGRSGTYTAVFVNPVGVVQTSVKVQVEYAPELSDGIEELAVEQGTNVSVACDADGMPLVFSWTCDGRNVSVSASVLNLSHVMTNASCTCRVQNSLGAASKVFRLHVVAPQQPPEPSLEVTPQPTAADAAVALPTGKSTDCPLVLTPAAVAVRFGEPVAIECTSSEPAIPGIFWEVPTGEVNLVNNVAIWSVQDMREWSGNARCSLNVGGRLCSKVPNIILYKPPDDVLISLPDIMLEGADYQLTCDVINVAPVQNLRVTWSDSFRDIETQTFNETASAPVNVSSFINVTAKREYDRDYFWCNAELHLGPDIPNPHRLRFNSTVVHYRPVFQDCPETFSGLENGVNLDMVPCKPAGNPAATVRWYHEGKVVNASEPLDRTRSGIYVAQAENVMGTSRVTVKVAVEHKPSFSCEPSYEVAENEPLRTVCKPGGLPGPVVSWVKDGKELNGSHQWQKEDSGDYLVRATNKHGTAEHQLYLHVLYAPRFSEGNSTVEVTPGGNVTMECSADANPPPEIKWTFGPAAKEVTTTGWRRSVLTISEATSANAGVYVCVATNKVGSVTRFHTLRLKGQSSTFLPEVFWALLVLLAVLLIIGLIVCFATCKTRRRHQRYSFVPSTSRNDSERSFPLKEGPEWMNS